MKIPVKRCMLCGALVADCPEDVELHRKFHERTAARPVRRPPPPEEPSRRPAPFVDHPGVPNFVDDCVPDDERRATENRAGGRALLFEQETLRRGAGSPLPRRRKADDAEPRAMYASPVRKDLGPLLRSAIYGS